LWCFNSNVIKESKAFWVLCRKTSWYFYR
jgi:hypothetical protein